LSSTRSAQRARLRANHADRREAPGYKRSQHTGRNEHKGSSSAPSTSRLSEGDDR
jgi:hypothetical protein